MTTPAAACRAAVGGQPARGCAPAPIARRYLLTALGERYPTTKEEGQIARGYPPDRPRRASKGGRTPGASTIARVRDGGTWVRSVHAGRGKRTGLGPVRVTHP